MTTNGCFNAYVMRLSAVESLPPSPGICCPSLRRLYTLDMDSYESYEEKPSFLPSYRKDTKPVSRSVLLSESFTRTFNGYKKIFCKHWYSTAKPRYFEKLCLESFVFAGNNLSLCFNNMLVFLTA